MFNKFGDFFDRKMFKADKVVRIPYEQMAEMIKREFIVGSNAEYLKKVLQTLKGGKFIPRKLESGSEQYVLVGSFKRLISVSGKRVAVCLVDNEAKTLYKLEKNLKFSGKLRKMLRADIENEKISK